MAQTFTLQILHYYGESGLLAVKTAPILGALVDKFDDQVANTLKIGEGDTYIPGPWLVGGADPSLNSVPGIGTTALGRPDIAILNALGTTASALGNHEFDLGSPVLQAAITASGTWGGALFPFITDNLDFSADSSLRGLADKTIGGTASNNFAGLEASALKGKIAPYAIVTMNGERIGLVGSTTFELLTKSSPNGTKPVDDNPLAVDANDLQEAAAKVQGAVNALTALGVNKIVEMDQLDDITRTQAVAKLVSGVDVWVTAGGHERLVDANDSLAGFNGHDATAYPNASYPVLTSGADGVASLIVTTDTEFSYLGRLVVDFDANGVVIPGSLNSTVNGAYAATEAVLQKAYGSTQTAAQIVAGSTIGSNVAAISNAINAVITAKDSTIFGYTKVYLEGDRVFGRAQEVNLGDVTADANAFKGLAATGAANMVSLKNGGGLRASLGSVDENGVKTAPIANPDVGKAAGGISQLDIENALRFDNQLMVFKTTAQGLKNILEYGTGLPAGNGGYPQLGGVRVAFDLTKPAGQHVTDIALTDLAGNIIARVWENGAAAAGAPATISVTCLNFTTNGGDGYPIKANASDFRYLLTNGGVSAAVDPALDFTAATTFATVGLTSANILGEQKAFEDYLQANYGTPDKAYNVPDTPASQDERIEDLGQRSNVVFGVNTPGTAGNDVILGSSVADTLGGGEGNDSITGMGGNDTLTGGNGNDTLTGGAGNDSIDGGAGSDIAVYDGSRDAAKVTRTGAAAWTVTTANGGTDAVRNVETLLFADGRLDISGLYAVHPVSQLATGDVDQDSAVLLAKAAHAGTITFRVYTDLAHTALVASQVVAIADPLVPGKVVLANGALQAGKAYYWTATDADGETESASFRTADADNVRNGFSMGVTGDWRGEVAPYPAVKNVAAAGLDLFVKLGDTIYADYPTADVPAAQATTLAEYRAKHNEVYSSHGGSNTLGDLQKTTAVLSMIDDHEVINDFAGGAPAASDPRFGTTTGLINQTTLYQNGLTAFTDYNPIQSLTYAGTGNAAMDGRPNLYRYEIEGRDAAVFLTDERSFRSQELAGVTDPTSTAQITSFLVQSFDPTRTLMGTAQLATLERDLLDAQARGVLWKFVMVPEPIQNLGVLGASDRYEGYAAERTALLKFINVNNLTNVVFVTADIHGTVVNNLTYQDAPGGPQVAVKAWEISTGSVGFDAPFGPTVFDLAKAANLLTPAQQAFYASLPNAPDGDSALNDKDDFIKSIVNQQVTALGYDPIGLNDNLAQANGLIDATLVSGDYLVTHDYTWSRFDVNAVSGELTVTTYGVPYYTAAQAAADPAAIAALNPTVVSQFTVRAAATSLGNALDFTLFRNALGGDAASNLTYANSVASGQSSSSATDSTGASLSRFLETSGDAQVNAVSFNGGSSVAGNPVLLDWGTTGRATLSNSAGTAIGAVAVNDFVGTALTISGFGSVGITGSATQAQSYTLVGETSSSVTLGSGNDSFTGGAGNDSIRGGLGNDLINGGAGSDTAIFSVANPGTLLRQTDGSWTVTSAEGSDTLVGIETVSFADGSVYIGGGTGPSSSQTPYLLPLQPNVRFVSLITASDTAPGGAVSGFAGVPDGIGAFANGDGTITVLVNHELTNAQGIVRAHGLAGAFVDKLIVDATTLQVKSMTDLATSLSDWNAGTNSYQAATVALSRLCSADLADPTAFFNAATGKGTLDRIYLNGEESGAEGRPLGWIVTGTDAGKTFELPRFGNMAFENLVARPTATDKTVVMAMDDGTGGQVYFYLGDKQTTGNALDKAGLTNGQLYGIKASFAAESNAGPTGGTFTLAPLGNVASLTGAQLETASNTAGVTSFLRPEDGAWDTVNPNRFYFQTTNAITGPSRLWALDFVDPTDPTKGGTITALLDGTEGQLMLDNLTVTKGGSFLPAGTTINLEDVGNAAHNGRIWSYDPATDRFTQIAWHDPARFGNDATAATAPFNQDEETSGVIDVTAIFGNATTNAYLIDNQAHSSTGIAPAIVENGQLLLMFVDKPQNGGNGNDVVNGSWTADSLSGAAGDDSISGGGGNDTLAGGLGNDTVVGGGGRDVASFSGARAATSLVHNPDGSWTATGPDGVDLLRGIEAVRFADGERQLTETAQDFLGRGVSDLLFQNTGGALALWSPDSGKPLSVTGLGLREAGSTAVDVGDYNGDGAADILFRTASGGYTAWLTQNGAVGAVKSLPNPGAGASFVGTGDVNGDGTQDIVFRTGDTLTAWRMQDGQVAATTTVGVTNANWTAVGLGDVNGDGTDDVVFVSNAGDVAAWLVQNGVATSVKGIGALAAGWSFAALGDFNGDGQLDLAFQHSSGTIAAWRMQQGTVSSSVGLGQMAAGWSVAGAGDINGDAASDLLFRHSSGTIAAWQTQEGQVGTVLALGATSADWLLV